MEFFLVCVNYPEVFLKEELEPSLNIEEIPLQKEQKNNIQN